MKINVQEYHIDCGTVGSEERCPIALAIKEKLYGKYGKVFVGNCTVEIYPPRDEKLPLKSVKQYSLPPEAREFVKAFDTNRFAVTPIEFTMRLKGRR